MCEERTPGFLVIDTMRLGPHSKGDDLRDDEEMQAIRERDPLARLGERLPSSLKQEIDSATRLFSSPRLNAPPTHRPRPATSPGRFTCSPMPRFPNRHAPSPSRQQAMCGRFE